MSTLRRFRVRSLASLALTVTGASVVFGACGGGDDTSDQGTPVSGAEAGKSSAGGGSATGGSNGAGKGGAAGKSALGGSGGSNAIGGKSGASGAAGKSGAGGSAGNGAGGASGKGGSTALGGASGKAGSSGGTSTGGTGGAPASVGESCSATTPCASGLICAGGTCVVATGPCTTNEDCEGDTYCCDATCSSNTGSECIAFGTGPSGNFDNECTGNIVIGLFEAAVQCEWTAPPAGDPFPDHVQVLVTPVVADLPDDSGAAAEIAIVTYNCLDGGSQSGIGTDPACYGVIRILSGQDCSQKETVSDPANPIVGSTTPALGDLDGDGKIEIVTNRANGGVVAFTWDETMGHYKTYWVSTATDIPGTYHWDGPAIHDLDDDGFPEIISGSEVYDGRTGTRLNPGQIISGGAAQGTLAVIGDVDHDGSPDLVVGPVYTWDKGTNKWVMKYTGGPALGHYAFADFGTPGATPADFDPKTLDGIAEIVSTASNKIAIATLSGQLLLSVTGLSGGGPPTIGDFDNDGFPEVSSAAGDSIKVVDFDCAAGSSVPGCVAPYVRWSQPSQDLSSATTASSIFDFEGDGKAEAVYADECFVRVYDGSSGDVLYSAYRTSCTWYENAIVADPDRDSNSELLVGSNSNCNVACPEIDPIHVGLQCADATSCKSGVCDSGFCRCTDDTTCADGYRCVAPPTGTPGTGNTCRAYHPATGGQTGLRVLRDRLDRWVSSRAMWNQHAYSITNVNNDGSIPRTSMWTQNYLTKGLNNYRQNSQGSSSAKDFPDITGKLDQADVCTVTNGTVTLNATVCNRGKKPVGAALPATFYAGQDATGMLLCTSYTSGPVAPGMCLPVSCTIPSSVTGTITMVVNDDGMGGETTIECDYKNNSDKVSVTSQCKP